ncbi:hypothetical protein TNCT_316411 [Trichonephila clavata]|uniref:Uncharacterized protein n=1 Tax=Trichonephila clavata TaxID=2740835 RepID=A0A8X6M109_TRICU|nr:hypothetical protein TNCT_316411 [Trichonephila clavata]
MKGKNRSGGEVKSISSTQQIAHQQEERCNWTDKSIPDKSRRSRFRPYKQCNDKGADKERFVLEEYEVHPSQIA